MCVCVTVFSQLRKRVITRKTIFLFPFKDKQKRSSTSSLIRDLSMQIYWNTAVSFPLFQSLIYVLVKKKRAKKIEKVHYFYLKKIESSITMNNAGEFRFSLFLLSFLHLVSITIYIRRTKRRRKER